MRLAWAPAAAVVAQITACAVIAGVDGEYTNDLPTAGGGGAGAGGDAGSGGQSSGGSGGGGGTGGDAGGGGSSTMTIATCGDDTVDLARDPRNCGRCDNSCSVGQYCAEGECGCRPEYSLIDGQCVDMDVDEDHCGLLDLSCPDNCEGGECVSTCTEGGGSQCGGCEKTTSDELHCGGCKNQDKCSSAGQLCMSGSCHGFVVGVGCTSCPCADCDDNVTYKECCVYPNAPADHIICIESGPCPE